MRRVGPRSMCKVPSPSATGSTPYWESRKCAGPSTGSPCAVRHSMSSTPPCVTTATRWPGAAAASSRTAAHHTRMKLHQAFTARQCKVAAMLQPPLPEIGMARLDGWHVQPFQHPKALLAQTHHRPPAASPQAAATGAAVSRARIRSLVKKRVIPLTGQARTQPLSLGMTRRVERHVDLALKALLAVPVGLAMADEKQFGHGRVTWQRVGRGPGRP
jgi:hypothetical protein